MLISASRALNLRPLIPASAMRFAARLAHTPGLHGESCAGPKLLRRRASRRAPPWPGPAPPAAKLQRTRLETAGPAERHDANPARSTTEFAQTPEARPPMPASN